MKKIKAFDNLEDYETWKKHTNLPHMLLVEVTGQTLYAVTKEIKNDESSTKRP
jgi:hypothetical protein